MGSGAGAEDERRQGRYFRATVGALPRGGYGGHDGLSGGVVQIPPLAWPHIVRTQSGRSAGRAQSRGGGPLAGNLRDAGTWRTTSASRSVPLPARRRTGSSTSCRRARTVSSSSASCSRAVSRGERLRDRPDRSLHGLVGCLMGEQERRLVAVRFSGRGRAPAAPATRPVTGPGAFPRYSGTHLRLERGHMRGCRLAASSSYFRLREMRPRVSGIPSTSSSRLEGRIMTCS